MNVKEPSALADPELWLQTTRPVIVLRPSLTLLIVPVCSFVKLPSVDLRVNTLPDTVPPAVDPYPLLPVVLDHPPKLPGMLILCLD